MIEGVDARAVVVSADSAAQLDTSDAARMTTRQQVWCATNGAGLITALVSRDKLADDAGSPAPLSAVALSRFDVEHGLASPNSFAVLSVPDDDTARGALLVGTGGGVTRYAPARIAPLLRLTRIGSRTVTDADLAPLVTSLAYPQNDLAVEVAGVSSRTFPERFRYRFTLRAADGRTLDARTAAEAQFARDDLPPGAYELEAQAFGSDLLASAPLVLRFEVAAAPFPWTIAWLSLLLVSAFGALVWGTLQNRRLRRTGGSLARANRELAAARLALATEAEAERRRIARDLHDQTLADLRRLMLAADRAAAPHEANDIVARQPGVALDPATLRAEVEAISGEVRRICEDLSPSVLENVGFAAALEWALTEASAQLPTKARFEFVCEPDFDARLRLTRAAQIQLYRIVQEVLSNICRHAAATRVRLDASLAPDDLVLVIRIADDGRGFAPVIGAQDQAARRYAGRGVIGIRARALLVGAEIAYASLSDGGTLFTLRVTNEPGAS